MHTVKVIARNPRSSGNYFRKLSPCTATSNRMAGIEKLTSFGVLDVYLFAEHLFPGSDCELQCVGRLLDGIALSSVRFSIHE